jgi:hypothetical protein
VAGFVLSTNGFRIDFLEINYPPTVTLGPVLEITNISLTFENFVVDFDAPESVSGSISFSAASAVFLPGKPVTGSVNDTNGDGKGFTATFIFASGSFAGFELTADEITFTFANFLSFTATDVMVDSEATGTEFVATFGSIGGTLTAGAFVVGATGRNLGITAEGDVRPLPGEEFGVSLSFGPNTADGLAWPSFLPLAIDKLDLTWPDVTNDPLNFKMLLTAQVTGFFGQGGGLIVSGGVEDLEIDVGLLAQGKFPFTGLAGFNVFVKGPLFGAEVEVGLAAGIVKIDNTTFDVLDPSTPSTDPNVDTVFYVAMLGGFKVPGIGLSMRLALSTRGPLAFYVEAEVPILLDPNTGLTLDRLRGGVEFSKTIPTPADAFALRSKAFAPPGDKPLDVWIEDLKQQISNQVRDNVTFGDPASIFQSPLVISAGADLYSSYASKFTFRASVDVSIDTTGKILINASTLYGNTLNAKTYLFGDLSQIQQGRGKFVFLVDLPEQIGPLPPLYTVFGEIEFEFLESISGGEPVVLSSATLQSRYLLDRKSDVFTLEVDAIDPTLTLTDDPSVRATVQVTANDAPVGSFTVNGDGTITVDGSYTAGDLVAVSYKVDGEDVTQTFTLADASETLTDISFSSVPILSDLPPDDVTLTSDIALVVTLDGAELTLGTDYTFTSAASGAAARPPSRPCRSRRDSGWTARSSGRASCREVELTARYR